MIHNLRNFRLWLEWSHGVRIPHTEHSSLYIISRAYSLRELCRSRSQRNIIPQSKGTHYRQSRPGTSLLYTGGGAQLRTALPNWKAVAKPEWQAMIDCRWLDVLEKSAAAECRIQRPLRRANLEHFKVTMLLSKP
jgi:hypothetical protein